MLEIEVIKGGVEIIASLSSEWVALCDEGASNMPFLRPEWFAALVGNFRKRTELITVRRNGRLRGLLPLMRVRDALHGISVRKLQAVFNPNTPCFDLVHGTDPGERTEIVDGVWKQLRQLDDWDVFECRLVKGGSWLGDLLEYAQKDKYPIGIWPMDNAPFITVPRSDDASISRYFSGPRKHLKKELARRLKRLKETGEVRFVTTSEYSQETIDRYLELESRGWKGRAGTAAVQDEKASALHAEFARSMARDGKLLIYELLLDSKTVAMSINIRSSDKLIHWKTTYDEEYSRYSPGNLLFNRLLMDCSANGTAEIDFLCPELPYKTAWATGSREYVALYIFKPSMIGWISWIWKFRIITHLRDLKTAYPNLTGRLKLRSA